VVITPSKHMFFFYRLNKLREQKADVTASVSSILPAPLASIIASYTVEEEKNADFFKAALEACRYEGPLESCFETQIFKVRCVIDYLFYAGKFYEGHPKFARVVIQKMQEFDIYSDLLGNKNRKIIIHILENNPMLNE
jgi:hypothetical protein